MVPAEVEATNFLDTSIPIITDVHDLGVVLTQNRKQNKTKKKAHSQCIQKHSWILCVYCITSQDHVEVRYLDLTCLDFWLNLFNAYSTLGSIVSQISQCIQG